MAEQKELNLDQMEQVTGGRKNGERGSVSLGYQNRPGERRWIKYQVQEGDTLWSIKIKFNCSMSDIKKWNNMRTDTVGPWMVLDLYTDR